MSYFAMDNNLQKYTITFCQNNSIIVVYLSEYVELKCEICEILKKSKNGSSNGLPRKRKSFFGMVSMICLKDGQNV